MLEFQVVNVSEFHKDPSEVRFVYEVPGENCVAVVYRDGDSDYFVGPNLDLAEVRAMLGLK